MSFSPESKRIKLEIEEQPIKLEIEEQPLDLSNRNRQQEDSSFANPLATSSPKDSGKPILKGEDSGEIEHQNMTGSAQESSSESLGLSNSGSGQGSFQYPPEALELGEEQGPQLPPNPASPEQGGNEEAQDEAQDEPEEDSSRDSGLDSDMGNQTANGQVARLKLRMILNISEDTQIVVAQYPDPDQHNGFRSCLFLKDAHSNENGRNGDRSVRIELEQWKMLCDNKQLFMETVNSFYRDLAMKHFYILGRRQVLFVDHTKAPFIFDFREFDQEGGRLRPTPRGRKMNPTEFENLLYLSDIVNELLDKMRGEAFPFLGVNWVQAQ